MRGNHWYRNYSELDILRQTSGGCDVINCSQRSPPIQSESVFVFKSRDFNMASFPVVETWSRDDSPYGWPLLFSVHVMESVKELKQRRRRGRRLVKKEFIFYRRNSRLSRSVQYANGSKNVLQLHMQRQRSIPNGKTKNYPASSTFRRHVVLQRTSKKCTKN